jgi:hypothetical protein
MNKRLLCAALLWLPVFASSAAPTKVSEHVLGNGLKVLVKEDHPVSDCGIPGLVQGGFKL